MHGSLSSPNKIGMRALGGEDVGRPFELGSTAPANGGRMDLEPLYPRSDGFRRRGLCPNPSTSSICHSARTVITNHQHRRICRCCAATCPLPVSIRQALPERSARLLSQPRARAHPPQVVEEGEIGWPRILRCLGQSKWNRLSHGRSHRRQEVRKQHDEQPCVRCRMERQRCRAVLAEVDEHRPVDHVVDHSPHRVEYH